MSSPEIPEMLHFNYNYEILKRFDIILVGGFNPPAKN